MPDHDVADTDPFSVDDTAGPLPVDPALVGFLRSLEPATLVDIVLDAAADDAELARVLALGASRWSGEPVASPWVEPAPGAASVPGGALPAAAVAEPGGRGGAPNGIEELRADLADLVASAPSLDEELENDYHGFRRWDRYSDRIDAEYADYTEAIDNWVEACHMVLDEAADLVAAGDLDPEAVADVLLDAGAQLALRVADLRDHHDEVYEVERRLAELHLAACTRAKASLDRVRLAAALFEQAGVASYGPFAAPVPRYAEVLGADGLAEYRRQLDDRRSLLPEVANHQWSSELRRLRQEYVAVARAMGDVDAELAALRDARLGTPDAHNEIETLRGAARTVEAVAAARRAIAANDSEHQRWLHRETLADLLVESGDRPGAVEAMWDGFVAEPTLARYRAQLEREARAERGALRARAIDHLRSVAWPKAKPRTAAARHRPDGSVLVEVLLHEKRHDDAWAAAMELGCSARLLLALAPHREKAHPADAIAVYVPEVERRIGAKNNEGYKEAVALITRIGSCHRRTGDVAAFATYVASVRAAHRPKRNLMAMLDQAGFRAVPSGS